MRKWLIALLAVTLAVSWVPLKAAQAASIIKTEDGLEFKFGMVEKVQFSTLSGLDFTNNPERNFRSLSVPDIAMGNQPFQVWNFTNLLFDLSKGPVSIHANLEVEAAIDERIVDVNHLNLERAALTYKTPGFGDLVIGFDVHLFDPEGGLIYQDEDPGIWLVGSQGIFSWNFGYHKRLAKDRGVQLGLFPAQVVAAPFSTATNIGDKDADIFEARVGLNLPFPGGNVGLSPMFLYYRRHVPQSGTADGALSGNLAACPSIAGGFPFGNCNFNPSFNPSIGDGSRANIYFPGLVATGKFGPVMATVEAVGQFGEVENLGPAYSAPVTGIYGTSSVDISTFAIFGELAFDLSASGIGLTPFINVDYRKGDDDPYDDTLGGYVAISDLTAALRKDGFKFQSISSIGPPTLGAGGEAAWGFNTGGRGIGPSIGSIIDDISLSSGVFFNNRFGKGDNPGMLKISGGLAGKVNSQWDMKAAASYLRYDTTEPIKAEAAANHISRGILAPTSSCPIAGPSALAGRALQKCTAGTLSVSEDMGVEFNFNVGYSPVPAFRVQPFVSVFIPLGGADDINGLFLDNRDTRTAYMAGVEFRAQF